MLMYQTIFFAAMYIFFYLAKKKKHQKREEEIKIVVNAPLQKFVNILYIILGTNMMTMMKQTVVHLATNEWWIYIFRKKHLLPIKSLRNRSAKCSFCQPLVTSLKTHLRNVSALHSEHEDHSDHLASIQRCGCYRSRYILLQVHREVVTLKGQSLKANLCLIVVFSPQFDPGCFCSWLQ